MPVFSNIPFAKRHVLLYSSDIDSLFVYFETKLGKVMKYVCENCVVYNDF